RRRLLRLGAPRYAQLLGISRGMALAGCFNFRHGDLPHAVRCLSHTAVSLVFGKPSRCDGWPSGGDRLRDFEYRRCESGLDDFLVAVSCFVIAVRVSGAALAIKVRRPVPCCDYADD